MGLVAFFFNFFGKTNRTGNHLLLQLWSNCEQTLFANTTNDLLEYPWMVLSWKQIRVTLITGLGNTDNY